MYLSIYLSTYLPIYLSTYLPIYLSTYLPIYLSTYLPIYLSIYLSLSLSLCVSLSSLSVSLCLSVCLPVCLSIYVPVYLQAWKRSCSARLPQVLNLTTSKRSNSARLPQCLNSTTSKTKQFCETSSFFKVDNIKNEAILRDFLNISTWQRQKRSNSARLPQHFNLTTSTRRRMARERRGAGSSLVSVETQYYKQYIKDVL